MDILSVHALPEYRIHGIGSASAIHWKKGSLSENWGGVVICGVSTIMAVKGDS